MTDASSHEPVPHRLRWLRRLVISGVALSAGLFTVRVCWALLVEHRLHTVFERCRVAGEPVRLGDFSEPDATFESSAAEALLEGLKAFRTGRPFGTNLDAPVSRLVPILATDPAQLAELIAENAPAAYWLRSAAKRPYVIWPPANGAGGLNPASQIYGLCSLIRLGYIAALQEETADADDIALADINDALVNARHLQSLQPCLLSLLLRMTSEEDGVSMLEYVLPTLSLSPKDKVAAQATSALDRIMRRLLDDAEFESDWRCALLCERASLYEQCLDLMPPTARGSLRDRIIFLCVKPAWQSDALRVFESTGSLARTSIARSPWTAVATSPSDRQSDWFPHVSRLAHPLSPYLLPNYPEILRRAYAHLARRRLAGTAVAIHLFECDHGQRPQTLSELAPQYITEVPKDPFSRGDDLSYIAGPPGMLWSVAPNAEDPDPSAPTSALPQGATTHSIVFHLH